MLHELPQTVSFDLFDLRDSPTELTVHKRELERRLFFSLILLYGQRYICFVSFPSLREFCFRSVYFPTSEEWGTPRDVQSEGAVSTLVSSLQENQHHSFHLTFFPSCQPAIAVSVSSFTASVRHAPSTSFRPCHLHLPSRYLFLPSFPKLLGNLFSSAMTNTESNWMVLG